MLLEQLRRCVRACICIDACSTYMYPCPHVMPLSPKSTPPPLFPTHHQNTYTHHKNSAVDAFLASPQGKALRPSKRKGQGWKVMDAGCGTGLAGVLFRNISGMGGDWGEEGDWEGGERESAKCAAATTPPRPYLRPHTFIVLYVVASLPTTEKSHRASLGRGHIPAHGPAGGAARDLRRAHHGGHG